jgi:WS/DGAT/MGAT family acyltransferase
MAAARPVHDERRMSDFEAVMWNLEKDPHLSSGFANLTVLDRPLDLERLRARMAYAATVVPRLRQRVVPALGRLAPPEWRTDPDFDVCRHVRAVALPEPGSMQALCDLAVAFAHDPFDRTRPLWEFLAVEGLPDGRGALLQRFHHTLTDGIGGVRMSEQYLDVTRDAEGPPVPRRGRPEVVPAEERSFVTTTVDTLTHNLRRDLGIASRATTASLGMVCHPDRVVRAGRGAATVTTGLAREVAQTDGRRSPLWTDRTLSWSLELLEAPLDEVKRATKNLGGTVNDVFVAAAAGGAGAYHRAKGVDVDELRMAMPVSTRTDRSATGNAFGVSRSLIPVGADPIARFDAVHAKLGNVRSEPVLTVMGALSGIANVLPTSVLVRLVRSQVETVDFTTSNVRGAPFDLFIAGARFEHNYPVGPLVGTAFNLTTLSYCGSLDMGLHVNRGAVEDPALLRDCVRESLEELIVCGS